MTTEIPTIPTTEIRWPAKYLPAQTHVFVSNEIVIPAPPEAIWAWLVRAELWPTWYPNAKHVHFRSVSGPDLRDRTRFSWSTFGVKVFSKVLEFEPTTRLAWSAHGIGVDAYHAWLLTPLDDGSTHVLTQETQNGWLARLGKKFMPTRMELKHQMWLEELSRQAQSGPPPSRTK
jgi:uncharacterized protein YndB with AHSA1/START domain